jgi:hypothetical protein
MVPTPRSTPPAGEQAHRNEDTTMHQRPNPATPLSRSGKHLDQPLVRRLALTIAACLALAAGTGSVQAAGVSVRFDLAAPQGSPFPSDRFTVPDWQQQTFRRVNLPLPDCALLPSDCQDIEVINKLDGFSTQPRITVPFTGAIDPASVTSETVYLVNLGSTLGGAGFGRKVGINQVAWDVASNTLIFESDELLEQHSRYALVVTTGVRDAAGDRIEGGAFGHVHRGGHHGRSGGRDRDDDDYGKSLRDGMHAARTSQDRVAALSVFTTQSTTADLEKIRRQIKHARPAPVNFMIGNGGSSRAVFPVAGLTAIQFNRQTGTTATGFAAAYLPTPALNLVPGAVASVAYGQFISPDYQNAAKVIPPTPTLTGWPRAQSSNELVVQVFTPSGTKPAGGWPVAIFGHGFTDSMYGAPWTVASTFASQGIATVSINVVGHGGGAAGTLTALPTAGAPVVMPAGGRGFDQDGNSAIDSTEGVNAAAPQTIIGSRDGLRQTVVDLMQLVRQIEVGIDVDGDGQADLDKHRIYYAGQSFGGIYGTILLGVEGSIQAGAPNVPGGSITEIARLGGFRVLTAISLASRQPQLLNLPPTPGVPLPFNLNFNENMPLRDQPVVINTVPGATAIQQVLERNEWVQQSGNPVSYAAYIRKNPLRGNAPKPVIFQFAKGDTTVPNPTTSAILRAGELGDRATYFRNDLAYAHNPQDATTNPGGVPKNPHTFLTNIGGAGTVGYAYAAQMQIATFFATRGTTVTDPDGPYPFFEVPLGSALPEGLNYLP